MLAIRTFNNLIPSAPSAHNFFKMNERHELTSFQIVLIGALPIRQTLTSTHITNCGHKKTLSEGEGFSVLLIAQPLPCRM
jgi:hypothetical protein